MAKTNAPLLSFGASGQIGDTQVYASWRGIAYARRYVIPANPNSSAQQMTRQIFTFLSNMWKFGDGDMQAPWTAFAKGKPLTNRNAFIGQNTKILRPGDDMTGFVGSPGANGGLPVTTITAAVASDVITATLTAPSLPSGWTITEGVALAVPNTDPHDATAFTSFTATDEATPYEPAITVSGAGVYLVSGWFVYSKPDGTVAYGPSSNTTATVA